MLKTFRIGGVHPPENKLSAGEAIITAALPKQAVVMLSQHIGAPAQAVVAKGDKVKVGTLLAQAGGFVSANIHSPVSGTVAKIDTAIDAAGYQRPAIIIDVEGDEWEESIDRSEILVKECKLDAKAIIDRIKECGIVGLGGATFPTHVKLTPPPGMTATILIINAVECEPYLTSDHQLMMEKGEEILVGTEILRKAINVDRAVIGIENNKPDAIAHMQALAANYPAIEICPLKVKYPQGGEKQLIDAVIRRQVPSGGLPIATGAVVQNVGTAFAVYEAVQKNKPLVERIVTVTGKSLAKPSNLRVRIGTPTWPQQKVARVYFSFATSNRVAKRWNPVSVAPNACRPAPWAWPPTYWQKHQPIKTGNAPRKNTSWTASNAAHVASPARHTGRCSTSYVKEKPKSAPSFAAATPNK